MLSKKEVKYLLIDAVRHINENIETRISLVEKFKFFHESELFLQISYLTTYYSVSFMGKIIFESSENLDVNSVSEIEEMLIKRVELFKKEISQLLRIM